MTCCVVGAGAAGLAAARHLKAAGIPFEVIERERDVGGIWDASLPHSPVYRSTHLISSKPLTQFPDFPMPAEYPDYPGHAQVLAYLRAYARRHALYDAIRFGQEVRRAERNAGGGWRVTFADGESRAYSALVVAAGIHWEPNLPEVPGTFEGEWMHSSRYKTPDVLRGKRVLVVGAGNSGCDIAVEAGQHAERTFLSLRRGYHFVPKYAFGLPIDQVGEVGLRLGLPLFVRRRLNQLVLRVVVGRPERFGLPRPDHRLLESHPIVNSHLLHAIGHGDVVPKPDLQELRGREVMFRDGSAEAVDLIVYATGYRVSYPFLSPADAGSPDGRPRFYLHVFHPECDDLFIIGMIMPDSGVWPLLDLQARAVAGYLRALHAGARALEEVRARKRAPWPDLGGGIRYLPSDRHRFEVEHSTYRRRLEKLIRLVEA